MEATVRVRPSELVIFDLSATRNIGDLKAGDFDQQVYGLKVLANVSPDLQLSSFVQYDDDTHEVGTNTRLRWTFHPLGDLFLVYNYNVVELSGDPDGLPGGLSRSDRWVMDGTQFMLKVQYALRY